MLKNTDILYNCMLPVLWFRNSLGKEHISVMVRCPKTLGHIVQVYTYGFSLKGQDSLLQPSLMYTGYYVFALDCLFVCVQDCAKLTDPITYKL